MASRAPPPCETREVIAGGYCIGCGACAGVAPDSFFVGPNSEGMLDARISQPLTPEAAAAADAVCPFSSGAEDETAIAAALFPDALEDPVCGRHLTLHAGHVAEGDFRRRGSSGGGVSWLIAELFARHEIDFVVHVGAGLPGDPLFAYRISRSAAEATAETKSRYYPTTLAGVLPQILAEPGRGLFVGVPCFVKALRNLSRTEPALGARIAYTAGLVCGHMKTAQFAENLAWQMGIAPEDLAAIDFRHMPEGHSGAAHHYFVRATDRHGRAAVASNQSLYGANWGQGLFKPKACDYCDDIFAETADITFGDAWIAPYIDDPRGDNIVLCRHPALAAIIAEGIAAGRLALDPISAADAIRSQWAGVRHRRDGTKVRVAARRARGQWVPRKRVEDWPFLAPTPWRARAVYRFREVLSAKSRRLFARARARGRYAPFRWRMRLLTGLYSRLLNRRPPPPPGGRG